MGVGTFFVGLIFFVAMAIVIRFVILRQMAHAARKKVPPHSLVYNIETGQTQTAGEMYAEHPATLLVPLHRRMIHSTHKADHGLTADAYMSMYWQPDPQRIAAFAHLYGEKAGNWKALDDFLAGCCAGALCSEGRPDCEDVAEAYGVIFSDFRFPKVEPETRDDRTRIQRILQSEFGAALARGDMLGMGVTHLASIKRGDHEIFTKYPDLKTETDIQMVADVMQSFLDRAKATQ